MEIKLQNLEQIPSPPGVAIKLLELFSSNDVSLDDINDVICTDPTLTARIIKYANSPMFARRHEASSLKQAITMLGANGVKMIALSFSLTQIKGSESGSSFDFDKFWNSSLATAVCNQDVYSEIDLDKDEGFLVGLLANIGQLAMFCCLKDEYEKAMEDRPVFALDLVPIEQEKFGNNRYALGAEVLEGWNFPANIVTALRDFVDPDKKDARSVRALELAKRMSYVFLSDLPDYEIVRSVTDTVAEISGNDVSASELFFANSLRKFSDIASILSYDSPEQKSLKEIELEAKTRIVEMTMNLHVANEQVNAENDELKDMAYIDPLTRLGNRRQYESIAGAELNRCARLRNSFGLLVVDIDHFKKVNDTYGHAAGDAILAGVAKQLEKQIRRYDFVFRYGGEEFVVILPETTLDAGKVVAERIRVAVESHPFSFENQSIPVTISLGGAIFEAGAVVDLDSLFKLADEALYEAKEAGRNRFSFSQKTNTIMPNVNLDVTSVNSNMPT